MDSALLGLVLDSSAVIAAERKKQPITDFIEAILAARGPVELATDAFTAWRTINTQDSAQDYLLQLFLPKPPGT